MADYGEPWHVVREMKDNLPDDPTHVAVDHDLDESDPENGSLVLESPDELRLARAVRCVNFLAGVSDGLLSGIGIDSTVMALIRAFLRTPGDTAVRAALSDRLAELVDELECLTPAA